MSERASRIEFAVGALLGGRYRLERLIGAGGMATVWRARDQVLSRPVAIKALSDALAANPTYVARFEREARTAARISHPNLVQVFDYSAAERPYLVMEYVNGVTLSQRLRRGPLSRAEVRRLACELLAALACVHHAGVLHRDIKPSNVLLGADGRARLTDFGIAQLEDSTRLTQPGQVVGTLRYLAPELLRGEPPTRRSDLYALGVLLAELPLGDASDTALRQAISQLSASEPGERPASAEAVLALLGCAKPGAAVAITTALTSAGVAEPPALGQPPANGARAISRAQPAESRTVPRHRRAAKAQQTARTQRTTIETERQTAQTERQTTQAERQTAQTERQTTQTNPLRARPTADAPAGLGVASGGWQAMRSIARMGARRHRIAGGVLALIVALAVILPLTLTAGSSRRQPGSGPHGGQSHRLTLEQQLIGLERAVKRAAR